MDNHTSEENLNGRGVFNDGIDMGNYIYNINDLDDISDVFPFNEEHVIVHHEDLEYNQIAMSTNEQGATSDPPNFVDLTLQSSPIIEQNNHSIPRPEQRQTGLKDKSQNYSEHSPIRPKMAKLENVSKSVPSFSFRPTLDSNHTVTSGALDQYDPTIDIDFRQTGAVAGNTNIMTNNEPPIFYQILDMFPDIDRKYLSGQCQSGLGITQITENILEMNNNHPKNICVSKILKNNSIPVINVDYDPESGTETKSVKQDNKDLGNDAQLKILLEIFPKADPNFLKEKSVLKGEALTDFINEAIDKKNYPEIVEQIQKEQEDEDVGIYTTNFDIQSFLKIFPDPDNYFMDKKRICYFNTEALQFLERRYRYHSANTLRCYYKKYAYNLTLLCQFLDTFKPTRKTRRSIVVTDNSKRGTINLSLLQEMCYLEHKPEIIAHIKGVAAAKKKAYKKAEAKGELIECGCCFSQVMFEDCATCNEGDLFCKTCILKSAEIRVGEGHTTFPCLQDCGSQFSLHLLQSLLDPRSFSRLLLRAQLDEVKAAGLEGLEICPFCEFASIPPPDTSIFTCLNPDCLKESCRKCHKVSHIPQRCDEVENDDQARARKYIEDEMTKALVRECYKCKKSFIKTDGCNKMTCTCGAKMCYICRQPVTDYSHFETPGIRNKSKCPLYSTEQALHVDAVKHFADRAKQTLVESNPDLKLTHDPTTVLPTAPTNAPILPAGVEENRGILLDNLVRGVNGRQAATPRRRPGVNVVEPIPYWNQYPMVPRLLGVPIHVRRRWPIMVMREQIPPHPMFLIPRFPRVNNDVNVNQMFGAAYPDAE